MFQAHIAALLALSSALCVAIGDVLQQRSTYRITDRSAGHMQLLAKVFKDQRWRWGFVVLVASIGLQATALDQGSVLLVQPLHMLSLLFALPINARLSHRTVTGREWIWAGLLTAAVIVIVTVGNPQAGRSSASLQTWAAVAVVFGPLLVGCVVAAEIWGGALAAVLFAFVSGSLWGFFAVLTKEVVARLGDGGWAVARTPELYAWLLVTLGGFVWGQAAFRAGPLTASMPTLQVSQPVVAAVLGVVILDETLNTGRVGMIALAVAALVMTTAIFELARVDAVVTRNTVEELPAHSANRCSCQRGDAVEDGSPATLSESRSLCPNGPVKLTRARPGEAVRIGAGPVGHFVSADPSPP
jgi:drug/metabolite transporter (DMT)-like permease